MYNIIDKLKQNKPKKIHIMAIAVVSIIIVLVVLMVPAQALNIDSSVKVSGVLKEVSITLNPNSNDKLPVKEIKLTRNGYNEACYFDVYGKIITPTSCKALDVVKIEKSNATITDKNCKRIKFKKNGKEYESGCLDSYGYGNGNNKRLSYNIYIVASSVKAKDVLYFELRLGNSNNPFSKKIVLG